VGRNKLVSQATVDAWLKGKEGSKPQSMVVQHLDEILAALESGKNQAEISRRLGIDEGQLSRELKALRDS
jgi:hypothetical protein